MAVGFVASATSGSQASVASFNIGTLGTGARAGIVFVATHGTGDIITGVTWNGVAMARLYRAADTDTEPGSVVAYFLDNVTNGTITVSRTNNAVVTVGYAASISAAGATHVSQTITRVSSTQNTNADTSTTGTGASGEVAVDDGSPGTNSMRFAAAYSGAATPPLNGTNSTNLQLLDSTALGSRFVRETSAGQGSRNVGFATGTTDDWALVAVAVSEIVNVTGTGAISVPPVTVAGTGVETFTATGAITVPSATVAGTGTSAITHSGTGAVSVPSATVSGTGVLTLTGTGALSAPSATVAGTGAEVFTATGAISVPAATVSGTGEEIFTATGAISASAPSVSGTGGETFTASGAITIPAATTDGSGTHTEAGGSITGTGAIGAPSATVAGTGTETISGTGALAVPAASVAGDGLHSQDVSGTGAISAPTATVAGSGDISGAGVGGGGIANWGWRANVPAPPRPPSDEEIEEILLL